MFPCACKAEPELLPGPAALAPLFESRTKDDANQCPKVQSDTTPGTYHCSSGVAVEAINSAGTETVTT